MERGDGDVDGGWSSGATTHGRILRSMMEDWGVGEGWDG